MTVLTGKDRVPRLRIMEVSLTPEQEAELKKVASSKGRDANQLAQDVLRLYLENEARFIEAVKRGVESLDRGEFVTHEDVGARIERMFPS